MQSHGLTKHPQRTAAVGLGGGRSATVQSRLFLCWLFPVVFQQERGLLTPCSPAYLVLPLLYFPSGPILVHFYHSLLFPQSNLAVHAQWHIN